LVKRSAGYSDALGGIAAASDVHKETEMLQKPIEWRRSDQEEGFTLVELMVVVLIIAILIVIFIPTFVGARQRAQDRAAESNARTGLAAEKTRYTDVEQFTSNVTTLDGIEPSINFVADEVAGAAGLANEVAVSVSTSTGGITNDTVVVGVKSRSGTCYYIRDVARSPGTEYASSPSCPATNGALPTFTSNW
jgi:type IV pilus assembly protein PilA